MSNILKRVLNVIFSDWTVFLPQYSTEKGILSYFTDIQKFLVNFIFFFFFFFFFQSKLKFKPYIVQAQQLRAVA